MSSKCHHLWTSRDELVNLNACVTEAIARSGNAINYDPDQLECNVKRCKPATRKRHFNDVMYDVSDKSDDVTALDYKLTTVHRGWDVFAISKYVTESHDSAKTVGTSLLFYYCALYILLLTYLFTYLLTYFYRSCSVL